MQSPLRFCVALLVLLLVVPYAAFSQNFTGIYSVTNQQGGAVTLTLNQDGTGNITGSMVGNGQRFTVDGMVEDGAAVGLIYNDQGEAGGRAGGGQGSLLGNWGCQTAEGPAQMEFVSQNQLIYNGERTQYSLIEGGVRIVGEYGPVDYRYSLSGNTLSVTDPYGQSMQCQRQAQDQSPPASTGRGGTGMERLLQGEKCAYSSSPDGGFSTTRRIYFDGNGRFVYGTLSEIGTPEVIGYGQGQGDPGSYRVLGNNRGDEVRLTFDSGSQVVVYAASLCPGG